MNKDVRILHNESYIPHIQLLMESGPKGCFDDNDDSSSSECALDIAYEMRASRCKQAILFVSLFKTNTTTSMNTDMCCFRCAIYRHICNVCKIDWGSQHLRSYSRTTKYWIEPLDVCMDCKGFIEFLQGDSYILVYWLLVLRNGIPKDIFFKVIEFIY